MPVVAELAVETHGPDFLWPTSLTVTQQPASSDYGPLSPNPQLLLGGNLSTGPYTSVAAHAALLTPVGAPLTLRCTSVAVDLYSGEGVLSGPLVVSVYVDGNNTVTFYDLSLDRVGVFQLRFRTAVVDANDTVRVLTAVTLPFSLTGACANCCARSFG